MILETFPIALALPGTEVLGTGIELAYLLAASLFILGLKRLGSPATARQGNTLAAVGMLIAIVATLLNQSVVNYQTVLVGIIIGSIIGAIAAKQVAMTAMPQMVGIFNGLGGAASALVAVGEYFRLMNETGSVSVDSGITTILGVFIGGVTLTGSLVAFAKLQGLITGSPITFPLQQPFNILLLISFLAGSVYWLIEPQNIAVFLDSSVYHCCLAFCSSFPSAVQICPWLSRYSTPTLD